MREMSFIVGPVEYMSKNVDLLSHTYNVSGLELLASEYLIHVVIPRFHNVLALITNFNILSSSELIFGLWVSNYNLNHFHASMLSTFAAA